MTLCRLVDLETTGEKPPEHAIIEIASLDLVDDMLGDCRSFLINPGRPIPADASAVHHLTEADIAEAPVFDAVWVQALHTPAAPTAFVAHNAAFELQWLAPYSMSVPWICTMKAAMRVWPEAPAFGLQFLRYWLHLGELGRAAHPPHRAPADCVVGAHVLMRLLQEASIDDMIAWSAEPPVWPRMPFGKHRGERWADVPADYFDWCLRQPDMEEDTKWNIRRELKLRADAVRSAYVDRACAAARGKATVADLEAWFTGEALARRDLGIERNDRWYTRIVEACADRKKALLELAAAQPASELLSETSLSAS